MNRQLTAVALVALVVAAAVPAAAVATQNQKQSASAYSGAHVSFDVQNKAVADYQVEGTTVLETVKVQSGSSGNAQGLFSGSVSLSAMTSIEGTALSLNSKTTASAKVNAEGSASMRAHDNKHGILVVRAGGNNQAVVANLSSSAEATAESSSQVEVTTEDGTKGTFIVVGEGSVTVNENGNVSAKLEGDSKLVFRSYADGKSEQDEQTEKYIASGKAAAEVYFEQQNGEMVTDTVTYGQETTVEAKQTAEGKVQVTVDRAQSTGKIVVTSVSEAAVGSVEDVSVSFQSGAATEVSSYSKLEGAIGSDTSKYMVKQSSSASAKANVYVAVNHFSERTMTMQSSDGGSGGSGSGGSSGGSDSGSSGASMPGFGIAAALVGALVAAFLAVRE